MKTIAMFIVTAAATLISGSALAADSNDRTSMPTNCSDRSANCVIQDGPPRGRRGMDTGAPTQLPSGSTGNNSGSGAGTKSGESKSGTTGSSR